MPVINMDVRDLSELCGEGFSLDRFIQEIPMIGATVEKVEGGEISVEFFPNRPDLFGVEGVARAYRDFSGMARTDRDRYCVSGASGMELTVGKGVSDVRPIIGAAVLKGVTIDEAALISIMNLQEKLHLTLGRKRSKVAIGIHDARPLKPPFHYDAYSPKDIRFVPLAKDSEWDLSEILAKHEKGTAYAWTLEGKDRYPVITDSKDQVLSFPPIINGELTRVTTDTEDIFVDCTGTDLKAVSLAVNIVCAQLIDRGGRLHSVTIDHPRTEPYVSIGLDRVEWPFFQWKERSMDLDHAVGWLGKDPGPEGTLKALSRMGYGGSKIAGRELLCLVPPWRGDILHEADLFEDLAIGIGYDEFPGTTPKEHTTGRERSLTSLSRSLRETLVGLGYLEAKTISISDEQRQFELMSRDERPRVRILNPITVEHTMMRTSAIPSLMALLTANRHRDLPQMLFEIADVMVGNRNRTLLTAVCEDQKASFTQIKGVVQRVLSDLYMAPDLAPSSMGCYIRGRSGVFMIDTPGPVYDGPFPELATDEEWPLVHFGEISPTIISRSELTSPVSAMEMDLTLLDRIQTRIV